MILQKLYEYYDRIDADPSQTIAQEGFAPQKVTFAVVLNEDGTLHDIEDVRDASGKKPIPQMMRLPFEKRTSGVKAMFLWDKAEYLLGHVPTAIAKRPEGESDSDLKKREKKIARVGDCHEATKELHKKFSIETNLSEYETLGKFFDSWTPTQLTEKQKELLEEVGTGVWCVSLKSEKGIFARAVRPSQTLGQLAQLIGRGQS